MRNIYKSLFQFSNQFSDIGLSFTAHGSTEISGTGDQVNTGSGTIRLSGCRADVRNEFLDQLKLTRFQFDTVDVDYSLAGRRLEILQLNGSGPELEIQLKGTVKLKPSLEKSLVNLKGNLQPDPSHFKHFSGIKTNT